MANDFGEVLAKHLEELWKSLEQWRVESKIRTAYKPEDLVYHYTTASGLKGILENRCLYATHYKYLNDLSEINFSHDSVVNLLKDKRQFYEQSKLSSGSEIDGQAIGLPASTREVERLSGILVDAIELIYEFNREDAYITSFCENGDLLSQWRGYANKGGGYAIGFSVKSGTITTARDKFTALEVKYDKSYQHSCFENLLRLIIDSFTECPTRPADDDDEINMNDRYVGAMLGWFGFIGTGFKSDVFSEEKEWRFVARREGEQVGNPDSACFREANGLLVPYLKLPLRDDEIEVKKIICGPTLHPERSRHSVKMFAEKHGFKLEIINSRIPLSSC